MSSEKLTPERAVRLLRAKAGELENFVKDGADMPAYSDHAMLAADIALIATLLADHMERCTKMEEAYIEASNPGIDMDQVRKFREGFDEGRPEP